MESQTDCLILYFTLIPLSLHTTFCFSLPNAAANMSTTFLERIEATFDPKETIIKPWPPELLTNVSKSGGRGLPSLTLSGPTITLPVEYNPNNFISPWQQKPAAVCPQTFFIFQRIVFPHPQPLCFMARLFLVNVFLTCLSCFCFSFSKCRKCLILRLMFSLRSRRRQNRGPVDRLGSLLEF